MLCDFGPHGLAYLETDPQHADLETIVQNFIEDQYDKPIRVLGVDAEAGTARDASEDIAATIESRARLDELASGARVCFLSPRLNVRGR